MSSLYAVDDEMDEYANGQVNDGPTTLIVDTDDYEGLLKVIRERLEKEERSRKRVR